MQDLTIKALSTVVFRLMDELEQIHAYNLDQRLASFLLNNTSTDGIVHMTQQTLAGHLGTTREVIARLMQGSNTQDWCLLIVARSRFFFMLNAYPRY